MEGTSGEMEQLFKQLQLKEPAVPPAGISPRGPSRPPSPSSASQDAGRMTPSTSVGTARTKTAAADSSVATETCDPTRGTQQRWGDPAGPSVSKTDMLFSPTPPSVSNRKNCDSIAGEVPVEQPQRVADAPSVFNSNSPVSNSSLGKCAGTNKNSGESDDSEPGGYGIPSGADSMKSLRRHVELLIDREINTKSRSRLETCLDALEPEKLDLQLLKVVCAKGLPEGCPALRSLYWRILLHCLPLRASDWQQHRQKLRAAYESYKAEFIREPEAVRRLRQMQQQQRLYGVDEAAKLEGDIGNVGAKAECGLRPPEVSNKARMSSEMSVSSISLSAVRDHPLSRSATSEWRGYWVDAEVFDQINKDVFRTRPELCFFALNPQQTVTRQQQLHLYPPPPTRQTQSSVLQTEEIPLLVSYDKILERQVEQGFEFAAAENLSPHGSNKPASSNTKGGSAASSGLDRCSRACTSSRRGFRLPSAFRSKKTPSASLGASSTNEDVWRSSSTSSIGCSKSQGASVRRGSRSFSTGECGRAGTHQQEASNKLTDERRAGISFIGTSVSQWVDELQRRGIKGHNRQPADAADALEASAAAARAAREQKRHMNDMEERIGNRDAHSSAPNLRLSSHDSCKFDIADMHEQAAGSNSVRDKSAEALATQLTLSGAGSPHFAAASADAQATDSNHGNQVHESKFRDGEGLAAKVSSRQSEEAAAFSPSDQRKEQQQPWRAPAGVQDVCNMLRPQRHYDVLSRLLFIYAKVNPGLCYVQGMNEILAPIYFTLMSDPTYTDYEQAEAEVFYCFSEIMQQQRDAFCKALDPTDAGVSGRLSRLDGLLRHKDEEIWKHLNAMGVEPQFYALRWLLLMLTQEFEMPDVLALWDGFIADSGRPLPLLYYVCVSMIIWLKPALLAGDFTACMKLLQHLPSFDPKALISSAMRLRADDLLGTRSPVWRAPVAFGESHFGDGLRGLDPLHLSESQQIKPTTRTTFFRSVRGPGSFVGSSSSHCISPLAASRKDWRSDSFTAASPGSRGDVPKDATEGSDAALGHLKRLAGAGVEQAYKGASVVSQYLNSSGLAVGLASNIASFFSTESQPCSSSPSRESFETGAGDSAQWGDGNKGRDEFSSMSSRSAHVIPPCAGEQATPRATQEVGRARSCHAPLRTYPSLVPDAVNSESEAQVFGTNSTSACKVPHIGRGQKSFPASSLGQHHAALAELLDTPRSNETPPFNSPTGEGLQITIL